MINDIESVILNAGAISMKVSGAGGGGFDDICRTRK